MFNAVSKLAFTVSVAAVTVGFGVAFTISDRVGFTNLTFAGVLAAAFGLASFYYTPRDPVVPVSPEVEAAAARSVDVTDLPRSAVWPLAAAAAIGLLAIGAALGKGWIVGGTIVAVIVTFAWLGQIWREHPSWTQAMTDRINERFVVPIGLPGTVIVFAGLGAISLSRIFLAVSADAAPAIGIVVAFAVLFSFWLLSKQEAVSRGVLTSLIVVSALLVAGAGVAGAVKGEREFHHAEDDAAITLAAHDVAFDKERLLLPASAEVTLHFENEDEGVQHNMSLYDEPDGEQLFEGEIVDGGESAEYEFTTPVAGEYYFQCDVHPDEMNGPVLVSEDASHGDETDEPGVNATTTSTTEP